MESKITVLMSSFNPGKYLNKALESVFNQTYSHWKLILVDDASTDGSLEKAAKYLKDPRVTVIVNKTNIGQAKSQNVALPLIKTPFMIQLDSDDWFFDYTLETMLNTAGRLPENIAVIYGNYLRVYHDRKSKKIKTQLCKGRFFKDRYDFLLYSDTVRPRLYRAACVKAIGGWPLGGPFEDRYSEDRRILLRLIEQYRFYWIDKPLYNYRRHSNNLTNNRKQNSQMIEWYVRDALKRWGGEYEPVFKNAGGWKKVVRLIKVTNKR